MILRWKNFTNIRTLMSLRITLAHFSLILTIISMRQGKGLVRYFLPILIIGKSIFLFMLSSGGKPACPRCCMVLYGAELYGVELFTLTPTLLLRLERCQSWLLKNVCHVPKFAPRPLLLALLCLNSTESEIAIWKLLLLDRLIKEPEMSSAMKSLFDRRTISFFDSDITSLGVLPSIAGELHKYELFHYSENWHNNSTFPIYSAWKKIVWHKIFDFQRHPWDSFCEFHPNTRVAQSCLENVSSFRFWSLADQFPDLISRVHVQMRLMGNFGLDGSLPWLQNTGGAICFICKGDIESVTHLFLDCSYESFWNYLKFKIAGSNPTDGTYICNFIENLDGHNKVRAACSSLR